MMTGAVDSERLMDHCLGTDARPSWRGLLHVVALVIFLPLVVVVAIFAEGGRARSGVIIYAVGLCAMLAVSATYHRWVHSLRARAVWRRADHATIFATIGGTFTPLCLVAVGTSGAIALLITVWSLACLGAVMKVLAWRHADRVGAAMYIVIGWAGVLIVPGLWSRGDVVAVWMVVAGGIIYTLGALGFALRWPTLRTSVFSYHEVWHLCTVVAAGVHLAAIWMVTT